MDFSELGSTITGALNQLATGYTITVSNVNITVVECMVDASNQMYTMLYSRPRGSTVFGTVQWRDHDAYAFYATKTDAGLVRAVIVVGGSVYVPRIVNGNVTLSRYDGTSVSLPSSTG